MEALRLGCEAFASDLNPVACLILKVMLEEIPRHGPGLADELRRVRRGDEGQGRGRVSRPLSQGPGRRHAHRLPVGADRAMRVPRLRRGDSPHAFLSGCVGNPNRKWALKTHTWSPMPTDVPLLRSGSRYSSPETDREVATGTVVSRARATCVCCHAPCCPRSASGHSLSAHRGGADVVFDDQDGRSHQRRPNDGRGHRQARRTRPPLPFAHRYRLRKAVCLGHK